MSAEVAREAYRYRRRSSAHGVRAIEATRGTQMPAAAVVIFCGGEAQLPAVLAAQELEFKAIVVDPSAACPSAALADCFLQVDLSKEELVFDALDACKARYDIRGAFTLAADFPIPLVASVNARYGLRGVSSDVAFQCTNKAEMRRRLTAAGVACPKWFTARDKSQALEACSNLNATGVCGVVFKPLDSAGGRGVTALYFEDNNTLSPAQVAHLYSKAKNFNRKTSLHSVIMVEELVEGEEVSVELLVRGVDDTRIVAITQKQTTGPPYFVEVGHSQPCDSPLLLEADGCIRTAAHASAVALGMTYCAGHVELKVRRDPISNKVQAVVMEAACRLGGGCIPRLTAKVTGVDMVKENIRIATGYFEDVHSSPTDSPSDKCSPAAAVQMIFLQSEDESQLPCVEERTVTKVTGVTDAMRQSGVYQVLVSCKPGQCMRPLVDDSCRYGFVCCEGTSASHARERALSSRKLIKIHTEPASAKEQSPALTKELVPQQSAVDELVPIFDSLAHPTLSGAYLGQDFDASFSTLRNQMRKYGIVGACAHSISAVGEHYDALGYLHQCRRLASPMIYPVAMIEPALARSTLDGMAARFAELSRMGYRAIKLHPRFLGLNSDWSQLEALVRCAASADLITFLCTWWHGAVSDMPTDDPFFHVVRILKDVPNAKLILMHGGGTDVLRYAELVKANQNVLLDVSCTICRYEGALDNQLTYLMQHCDQRICIGSDFPEFTCQRLRKRFDALSNGLPLDKRRNVAFRSLTRFLGLPLSVDGNSIVGFADGHERVLQAGSSLAPTSDNKEDLGSHCPTLNDAAVQTIRARYQKRLNEYGPGNPKSLGWMKGGQDMRLRELLKPFALSGKSVLDIGCGFGDALNYIPRTCGTRYTGIDLVEEFVSIAKQQVHKSDPRTIEFESAEFLDANFTEPFDFVFGSGLFNRKLGHGHDEYAYIEAVLRKAYSICNDGFAFDFLSSKVDFMVEGSHHSDPQRIMEIAFSLTKHVQIHHHMRFEFVLIVFKPTESSLQTSTPFVDPTCISVDTLIPYRRNLILDQQLKYASEAAAQPETNGAFTRTCQHYLHRCLQPNCEQALLMPSCSAALELAAMACDFEIGDEVIMPSFTFTSTANAFLRAHAVPVFVDVTSDTLNIDPSAIEQAITARTRAIVVVHYAGVSCDMARIMSLANQHEYHSNRHGVARPIIVIEDAAHAFGSSYKGIPLGTIGHMGCFSFHYTKNICCGEGGAITVNNVSHASASTRAVIEELSKRVRIIREKGTNRDDFIQCRVSKYHWLQVGSSFLISEPTAAVLLAQLEEMEQINSARVSVDRAYRAGVAAINAARGLAITLGSIPDGCGICGHIVFLLCETPRQAKFIREQMLEHRVQVFSHYEPLHAAPGGANCKTSGELPITNMASQCIVRLPMWPQMTAVIVDRVLDALSKSFVAWRDLQSQLVESAPTKPVGNTIVPSNPSITRTPLQEQHLRNIHYLSIKQYQDLLASTPEQLQQMRANCLAGDAYVIVDAMPKKQLLHLRECLSQIGRGSLPNHHPIAPGAPDFHRMNVNDPRSYVKGCFHQFSFFPWNQNMFDVFSLFGSVFEAKNLLSGLPKTSFLGTDKEGQDQCCARLSFQHYPSGIGHLARHADPVDHHQVVVPIVLMSAKRGHAGSKPGEEFDFVEGGLFLERSDGTRVCVDDLGGVGTVVFTNARVAHGVEPIDPISNYEKAKASDIDWLAFKGRWMAGVFVNKLPGNTEVGNAVELAGKKSAPE